ncbi:MAG TPA: hypothetical protein VF292_14830 [Rhodanobacteraceae bacterium]
MDPVSFAQSAFPPLALGFFGLGTGYMIYGPEELFGWPKRNESVDKATGMWAIWMPGFCQFVAGTMLFIGLGWFQVWNKSPDLYMAAFAFSAYGTHWFAMGWNRYHQLDPRVNFGMCIAYTVISVMGIVVFFGAGDIPVGVVFVGLTCIYLSDAFAVNGSKLGERALGFNHLWTGGLLLYCAFATSVNLSLGWHWPL